MTDAHQNTSGFAADGDTRLRGTLEECPIGVTIFDLADGRRMYVNPAFVKMMAADTRDELLQGEIADTWVDPARFEEAWEAFRGAGNLVNYEAERMRLDGTRWWVLLNTQIVNFEGVPAGIVWHIDITARKQAEEALTRTDNRFQAATESLFDAFAMFDAEDRLVFCNSVFRDHNPGLTPILRSGITYEEILRDNLADGRILDALGREEEFIRERMERHRNPGEPFLLRFASGKWLLIREKKAPDGSTFLVNTDLTELRDREDALRAEKERAELASGFKSQFLATMSHELRTPLNAILAFSEIMRDEMFGALGDPRYRDYTSDIYTSGRHLLDLINDVLDLSRVEAGRYELSLADTDIGTVVQSASDVLREQTREKALRLVTQAADSPTVICADERALRQVLMNLLSNAVKFTPEGGEIRIETDLDPKGNVSIVVADTGVGMASNEVETAMMPFSQLTPRNLTSEGGTGLGLSIAKALVELHGGRLEIDSMVGEGTTVTVTLPVDGPDAT